MKDFKLDKKDKRILYELDMDARQSISKIAKKVRLSKEVTNYRVKRLEKEKIIEGYYVVLDNPSLGYIYHRLHLWFYNLSKEKEKEIIEFLRDQSSVNWINTTAGEEDLVIISKSKNYSEIKSVFDEVFYKFSRYIKQKKVYIITKVHSFKHNYLYDTSDMRTEILGNKNKEINVDEISIKILNLLSQNARMPSSEIASKIGLTPNAIRQRIRNLVKKKIILFYRAKIDLSKLGYRHFKLFLRLKDINQDQYNNFIAFLKKESSVINVTESIGEADLEFEIIVKTITHLYSFMDLLKSNFGQNITDYRSYYIRTENKIFK